MGVPVYLMEMTYLDPSTLQTATLRFSSGGGGYCTRPTDDPPSTYYEPRISIPNNWQAAVFKDGLTGGGADGGLGTAQLINNDGHFDQFMSMAWDGQPLRLLYGDNESPYTSFDLLLTGTMCQPEFNWHYMNVKVRDYSLLLSKALSQFVYLGNNVVGVGVEGTTDDLLGKTKPLCFGHCLNVTPALVSASAIIFQVHNGPIKAVETVYIDGIGLPLDTGNGGNGEGGPGDFATHASLAASTIAEGKFQTCLAEGMFKVYGSVSSGITADVLGCNHGGSCPTTAYGIIRRIVEHYIQRPRTNLLYPSEDFTDASWATTGLLKGSAASTAPKPGMGAILLLEDASSGPHSLSKTMDNATGMYCFSIMVLPLGRSLARLKLQNPAATENNCLVDFDLVTGAVLLKQSNGQAVGPQYTATGFITDGGVIQEQNGWLRLWIAGQPDESFSQIKGLLLPLSGTPTSYVESYPGNGGPALGVSGAQLEAYSSPATYTGPTFSGPLTGYDPILGISINEASFSALAALGTADAEVGYSLPAGDTSTSSDVMNALAASVGCFWAFDRTGELRIGQFAKPSPGATPVARFTKDVPAFPSNIIDDSFDRYIPYNAGNGTIAFRIVMNCIKNWTVLNKSSVATSLWTSNPTWVCWLGKEWREMYAEDLNTLAAHPLACVINVTSYIVKQIDALDECKRILALYGKTLGRFNFKATIKDVAMINIGDIVFIQMPRFDLSSGRNFIVVGITELHEMNEATLEVLG
jgi:hypothetical protein